MSEQRDQHHGQPHVELVDLINAMTIPVAGPDRAPDMTESIMGRLGYQKVSRRAARWQMARIWSGRMALAAAACFAIVIGVRMNRVGPDARVPTGITVPRAINHDVDSLNRAFDGAFDALFHNSQTQNSQGAERPADQRGSQAPAPSSHPEHDAINNSAVAAVRWI